MIFLNACIVMLGMLILPLGFVCGPLLLLGDPDILYVTAIGSYVIGVIIIVYEEYAAKNKGDEEWKWRP